MGELTPTTPWLDIIRDQSVSPDYPYSLGPTAGDNIVHVVRVTISRDVRRESRRHYHTVGCERVTVSPKETWHLFGPSANFGESERAHTNGTVSLFNVAGRMLTVEQVLLLTSRMTYVGASNRYPLLRVNSGITLEIYSTPIGGSQ